jgi:hypothetical protein
VWKKREREHTSHLSAEGALGISRARYGGFIKAGRCLKLRSQRWVILLFTSSSFHCALLVCIMTSLRARPRWPALCAVRSLGVIHYYNCYCRRCVWSVELSWKENFFLFLLTFSLFRRCSPFFFYCNSARAVPPLATTAISTRLSFSAARSQKNRRRSAKFAFLISAGAINALW